MSTMPYLDAAELHADVRNTRDHCFSFSLKGGQPRVDGTLDAMCWGVRCKLMGRQRRFRVYKGAPGFRPGPRCLVRGNLTEHHDDHEVDENQNRHLQRAGTHHHDEHH